MYYIGREIRNENIRTHDLWDRVRASVTGTLLLDVEILSPVFKSIRIIFLGLNREISQLEKSSYFDHQYV